MIFLFDALDKALFTRGILKHNIAIKKYFWAIAIDPGKAKVSSKQTTNQGSLYFIKSLVIEIHGSKISFYSNIVCKNVSCE